MNKPLPVHCTARSSNRGADPAKFQPDPTLEKKPEPYPAMTFEKKKKLGSGSNFRKWRYRNPD